MSNKPKFAVGDIVFCEGMRVDKFIITRILDNLLYEAEPYKDIYILGEEDIEHAN